VKYLIPLILACSLVYSQNTDDIKKSFLSKVHELGTEDQLLEHFNLSYKAEITSKFTNEELYTNRIILLNKLIGNSDENKGQYLDFIIDLFLANKNLIDFNRVITWASITDVMFHLNKNKIYREDMNQLFRLLFEINDHVKENKISNSELKPDSFDIELTILSWGLANYYDLVENKELAVEYYEKAINYLDIEKYYEVFEYSLWECLGRLFYINLDLSYSSNKISDKKFRLQEAEEFLLWINSVDLSEVKYKGAETIKNNVNRSYAFKTKDYKKERIFIDKLINSTDGSFDISIIDLTNKYNLNLISKNKYAEELVSLFDYWDKPYDSRVISYLNKEEQYQANLNLYLRNFTGLTYYNNLSNEDQIKQFGNRFKDFMILKGNFIDLSHDSKKSNLKNFIEYIIKLENYNTNNKEIYRKNSYEKINKLTNEKRKLAEFIEYNRSHKEKLNPTMKVLNLNKIQERVKFLEQDMKRNLMFSEIFLKDIQNELLSDQAIVRILQDFNGEYFDYYCIIITSNSIDFLNLNDNVDFERVYKFYLNKLNSRSDDSMSYDFLFKKIHKKLNGIKDVFFINKGVYANVNLEGLKLHSGEFLYDIMNISYLSDLLSIANRNNKIAEIRNSLLIGDPIFDIQNKKSTQNSRTRSGIYQLPSTRIEIESINKILKKNKIKTISLLGETATELNFKNNLKSDLIHIATHGFYKKIVDFPEFGLFFANSGNSKIFKEKGDPLFDDNDNILRGDEIKYLNLSNTELLVLSACETAVSFSLMIGNYNLSDEFIRSGVKNVLSTIWKVDDEVTQKFMTIFYKNLSKGNSINSSLKVTKLKIREDYPHPYYWAPFVLLSS